MSLYSPVKKDVKKLKRARKKATRIVKVLGLRSYGEKWKESHKVGT